jgi:N-methylhydantoinase B
MAGQRLTEHLTMLDGRVRCRCGRDLGPADGNYKLATLVRELPLPEANPHTLDPAVYVDAEVVSRHFYCPGCATQLATEVAVNGQPPQWDSRVQTG